MDCDKPKAKQLGNKGTIRQKTKKYSGKIHEQQLRIKNETIYGNLLDELKKFDDENHTDYHDQFNKVRYRRIDHDDDDNYIHDNQLLAANMCVLYFILGKILKSNDYYKRGLSLIAEMQAGKTGTYSSIIFISSPFKNAFKCL